MDINTFIKELENLNIYPTKTIRSIRDLLQINN